MSGGLRQRRTGVGWASLKSLPAPAPEPTLTVSDVDDAFEAISGLAGQGSAVLRAAAVEELFARATEPEQRLLRGLVFDEIRQGALDSLVQDGLAEAFGVPGRPCSGRQCCSVRRPPPQWCCPLRARRTCSGGLQVGQPVRPMLAASAPDPAAAIVKSGLPAVVDFKLDGIRVQVHRRGETIRVYTRSLDDITERVPDIVAVVAALPATAIVLDGEVLSVGPDGGH